MNADAINRYKLMNEDEQHYCAELFMQERV